MTRYFGVHTLEGEWHALLPRYVLLADRVQDKRILDIGCGTGIGSSLLLDLGAEQVNAVDHRPAVLELARVKHAKEGLDFHVMFWEELDFPDDSFDMVLCLDPTSPVTDPSLLLEIKRVLKSGGEYVCAIEKRNVDGMEALLPRYGYADVGENIEMTRTTDRVPQIGELSQFFETIVPVVQRPQYSFLFDVADGPDDSEVQAMRKISAGTDESGIWVGDDPQEPHKEQTDQRPGRWIGLDDRLCDRDGDPAAVEVLFCGDAHLPPPALREVRMPYLSVVSRLHQLFSELQVRQHPAHDFDDVVDHLDEPTHDFSVREKTSEFQAPLRAQSEENSPGLRQIREQLDQMTHLYQQVRTEMENLFVQTRNELMERDRYIERLVDTVHRWQHKVYLEEGSEALEENAPTPGENESFGDEPTQIFSRTAVEDPATVSAEDQESSEPEATAADHHGDDDASLDSDSEDLQESSDAPPEDPVNQDPVDQDQGSQESSQDS